MKLIGNRGFQWYEAAFSHAIGVVMKDQCGFEPAWWLRNAHAQTLWSTLFRAKTGPMLLRERVELPDGDFVDLDWAAADTGPTVLILHGLEGSSRSPYARGLMQALSDSGYRPVLMHFRGCSGVPNRRLRRYHAGDTADLAYVAEILRERRPGHPLSAIGFSLGGNALLKWLGETGAANPLLAAAAVSVPFDLAAVAVRLNSGLSKIYRRHLLRRLIATTSRNARKPGFPLPAEHLRRLKDMRSYDQAITAPLHGFKDADDYYTRASCRPYLRSIAVPTLLVHALDDPFMQADVVPEPGEVSQSVTFEISPCGGHVGFIAGRWPWQPRYWLESRLIGWLEALHAHEQPRRRARKSA